MTPEQATSYTSNPITGGSETLCTIRFLHSTMALLQDALELAKSARQYVNVHCANTSLSEKQANDAFDWLQYSVFEKHFMHNETLMQRIQPYDTSTVGWSREETKSLRNARRRVFKVWLRDRMGNIELFLAIVKHGFFDTQSLSQLMVAYNQLRDDGDSRPSAALSAPIDEAGLRKL